MPASVFMLHGTTAMPSVSKVPLAMAAPMLPMSCVRKASPARSVPLMPVSSCRTRSLASLVTRWTSQSFSLRMASSSETHRIAPAGSAQSYDKTFFHGVILLAEALVCPVIQGCAPERFRRRRPARAEDAS